MAEGQLFDANTFIETQHKGGMDTAYVLPDEGDYLFQITDQIRIASGEKDGRKWASCTFQVLLLGVEAYAARVGMPADKVFASLDCFIDIDQSSNQLDLGVNKSMRLKRLAEATGINKQKQWSIGSLKFATAYGKLEHVPSQDGETMFARITRFTSQEKAAERMAAE